MIFLTEINGFLCEQRDCWKTATAAFWKIFVISLSGGPTSTAADMEMWVKDELRVCRRIQLELLLPVDMGQITDSCSGDDFSVEVYDALFLSELGGSYIVAETSRRFKVDAIGAAMLLIIGTRESCVIETMVTDVLGRTRGTPAGSCCAPGRFSCPRYSSASVGVSFK